jgi:hypothetical protein
VLGFSGQIYKSRSLPAIKDNEAKLRTVVLTLMAFATALVAAAGPVQGDTMKASDVENICRTNSDTCKLFIFGLAQGLSIRETMSDQVSPNGQYANRKPVLFCLPENITTDALMMAFKIKVAEDLAVFPDDRNLEGPGFSAGVLLHLFPCKK